MVAIVERVAAKDWSIEDQQGARQEVKRGKSYTTTRDVSDGHVTLFSRYWVPVPIDVFQSCPACGCALTVGGEHG